MSKISPAAYTNLRVANATLDAAEDRALAAESALSAANARVEKLERVAEKAGRVVAETGGIIGLGWMHVREREWTALRAALSELKKGST